MWCVVWFQLYWSILQPILASTRSDLPKPHFICGNDRCYDEEWTEKHEQLFVSSRRWAGVGKTSFIKRNQSTAYICTWPFSHKPKLSTSVFSALTAIILESWIRSLLQRSIRAFRAIAPSSYDHWCFKSDWNIVNWYTENNSESESGRQMAQNLNALHIT